MARFRVGKRVPARSGWSVTKRCSATAGDAPRGMRPVDSSSTDHGMVVVDARWSRWRGKPPSATIRPCVGRGLDRGSGERHDPKETGGTRGSSRSLGCLSCVLSTRRLASGLMPACETVLPRRSHVSARSSNKRDMAAVDKSRYRSPAYAKRPITTKNREGGGSGRPTHRLEWVSWAHYGSQRLLCARERSMGASHPPKRGSQIIAVHMKTFGICT